MIQRTRPVVAVAVAGTAHTLELKQGSITLDESWAPYGQASLECVKPADAVMADLDPRDAVRLEITVTDTTGVHTYDLGLRSAEVNHRTKLLELQASTDEAILQDDGSTDTAPDDYGRAWESDLRALILNTALSVVPGATLEIDDMAGADLTIYKDQTNLLTNPSAETNASGWTGTNCTLTRAAPSAAPHGAWAFRMASPTTSNSHMLTDAIGVTPGERYVIMGQGWASGSGTEHSRARKLVILNADTGAYITATAAVPNTSTWTDAYLDFTVPAGVSNIKVAAYHGYTAGTVWWDALKFAEYAGAHDSEYFDGSTTDTDLYAYAWEGTANASASIRTNITGTDRALDTFTWYPGVSAWDYIHPLVQVAGLRLYCDEQRRWHLVDPNSWQVPGALALDAAANATDITDGISRDSDEWADAVVIQYAWTDENNTPHRQWDSSGSGTKVLLVERSSPFPGAGAAAAMAARMDRMGYTLEADGVSQWHAAASMPTTVTMPDGSTVTAFTSAVTLSLSEGTMTAKLREAIPIPDAAWLFLPLGESWLDSPPGESWLEETV